MFRFAFFIVCLLTTVPALSQHAIKLEIHALPANHIAGSEIFVAGSFNGWNPRDTAYRLGYADGSYTISLQLPQGVYEYKFTRGGWDKVECSKDGTGIANRVLKIDGPATAAINIEGWQDRFAQKQRANTASKNVCVIDTAFVIPQLNRTRRVWIYLPEDYCDGTKRKYPVLYMHDGQNLFDEATGFSGEWGIDEFMDTARDGNCIVVGIDHGGDKRLNEYNPYDNQRFGKGEADMYTDFLVKTLKPFIDKRFRTLRKKKHTFIAGSSMGGLVSIHALLRYPKVFGGAAIFSPAFWVAGPTIFNDIKQKGNAVNATIYLYAGKMEGDQMVPDLLKALEAMAAVSKSEIKTVIRDEGRHNEATWRNEFPAAFRWMRFGN